MHLSGSVRRLTIYVDDSDRCGHQSLAEAIIERAKGAGLAGATMFRGIEGFGAGSRIHTTRIVDLADQLPVVIEIIDRVDRIEAFLPVVEQLVEEGLVTVESVDVALHRSGPAQRVREPLA